MSRRRRVTSFFPRTDRSCVRERGCDERRSTPEKLLDRVRKLVALACDDRAPEPERDAAMSLAQALMTKHAIDEARLGAVGQTTEHVVNRVFTMPAPYSKAKAYGFSLVACAVGLKTVNLPARRSVPGLKEWRLHVFGYESDVEFFDFLLASLMVQMTRDGAQAYDGTGQIFWTSLCHGVLQRRGPPAARSPQGHDRGAGRRARYRHRARGSH